MAAWFVSNCKDAPSQRFELVNRLQEFITVDIYGKCGIRCPRFPKKCADLSNYWFYFAFENSLCTDYVTEKVFANVQNNAVLVVYNGAEMNRMLPPNSYIDANSFKTARDLAKYLIYLTKNPEEYMQFFWWKEYYYASAWAKIDKERICDAINTSGIETQRKSYANMTAWFHHGCSSEPKIKF